MQQSLLLCHRNILDDLESTVCYITVMIALMNQPLSFIGITPSFTICSRVTFYAVRDRSTSILKTSTELYSKISSILLFWIKLKSNVNKTGWDCCRLDFKIWYNEQKCFLPILYPQGNLELQAKANVQCNQPVYQPCLVTAPLTYRFIKISFSFLTIGARHKTNASLERAEWANAVFVAAAPAMTLICPSNFIILRIILSWR